ncbi:response regulator [Ferrimonas sp. SCSIO 43195]|uniref:response regulator n=1 Tax=Ferrimonas sp. SCSIO 43195 TaxID=2822844 RepID=UPI002075AF72|nr:response regulator [Ferrimonas sp. SCSIO 43195]USD37530.1 response regulator [Ferrimonas sp. SCSIO 43195]
MTLSILLAEDDVELNSAIEEALHCEGFTVVSCHSAEQALDQAEQQKFDIALLDLVMPGMTGVDAIAALRRLQPGIGIVITTAFATVDTAVDAMKRGADDFVTKPFNLTTLATTLRRVQAQRQPALSLPEEEANKVFSALSNPMRRAVLQQLSLHKKLRFMDLCRLAGVDNHTQFNFHLRQLKQSGLVEQNANKIYFLTTHGQQMVQFIAASSDE